MVSRFMEWWKNPDHRMARAEPVSSMYLREQVLRMSEDRAKRILYELVSMDLNEDPLRGYELQDIVLYDNEDYILMGSSGPKDDPPKIMASVPIRSDQEDTEFDAELTRVWKEDAEQWI